MSRNSTCTARVTVRGALPPYPPNVVLVYNLTKYRANLISFTVFKAVFENEELKIRNSWKSQQHGNDA
jgi:hypothetical protein